MVGKSSLSLTSMVQTAKKSMSLGTFYILSDAFYDYGLVKLPSPLSEVMYYGRYAVLIFLFLRTQYLKRENKITEL